MLDFFKSQCVIGFNLICNVGHVTNHKAFLKFTSSMLIYVNKAI